MVGMLNLRPSKIQLTRRNLAWAAAIGILAAGLRILWLAREPLFIDEFADLEIARRSVGGIIRAKDGFPPLFALLAHGWMFVFGTLESVRLLSVILGVGAVALCAIAGGLVAGERGAAFAGLFAAVNPLLVFHAQEGRAYGLVPFVTAWLVMAALALMTGRVSKAWWINLGLGSIAAVWTHYFLWVVVAIVGVKIGRASCRERV